MHWDIIIEEFLVYRDSEYLRFLHMQALKKVLNTPTYD